jgi:hypothetical protein
VTESGHWSIENGLHYRRDVTFHADAVRTKPPQAAQVMAVFNNLVLGFRGEGILHVADLASLTEMMRVQSEDEQRINEL